MKKPNVDKKVFGLGLLIVMLILMGTFSIDRLLAPSAVRQVSAGPVSAVRSAKADGNYAMLPYELTPPGEETPVNTSVMVATPIPTSSGDDE